MSNIPCKILVGMALQSLNSTQQILTWTAFILHSESSWNVNWLSNSALNTTKAKKQRRNNNEILSGLWSSFTYSSQNITYEKLMENCTLKHRIHFYIWDSSFSPFCWHYITVSIFSSYFPDCHIKSCHLNNKMVFDCCVLRFISCWTFQLKHLSWAQISQWSW